MNCNVKDKRKEEKMKLNLVSKEQWTVNKFAIMRVQITQLISSILFIVTEDTFTIKSVLRPS